jgi:hypothetical protein
VRLTDNFSLSLLSAASLAHHFPHSTAFDRPIHTVVLALTACSFALPSISRALPRLFQLPEFGKSKSEYTAVPLEELGEANGRLAEHSNTPPPQNGKVRVSVLALAICALSVRIELYRRISLATECAISSVEVFLPFLLAVWDAFRSQRSWDLQQEETPDSSVYESLRSGLKTYILRPRTRHLISLFMVSYGCYLCQGLWASSNSTYICPVALGLPRTVPLMQIGSLVLDLCLAVIAYEIAPKPDGRGLSGRRCVVFWSSAMISTSVVWCIVATVLYIFKPEVRLWLLFLSPALEFRTMLAMAGHIFTFCVLCISLLHCVSSSTSTSGSS